MNDNVSGCTILTVTVLGKKFVRRQIPTGEEEATICTDARSQIRGILIVTPSLSGLRKACVR
jgi:hypothetical protein